MVGDPKLVISATLWERLLVELHRRTNGCHESGAFLLGRIGDGHRRIERIVYYDDLDPGAYRTGIVILHGASFGQLWELCRSTGLAIVTDIHVHAKSAVQSKADRDNPMIARAGHLAFIAPWFGRPPVLPEMLGLYEYLGSHRWRDFSRRHVARCLHIEH